MLRESVGTLLILASILDAWKYIWQANAIIRNNSAKGHSRKFINAALFVTTVKILYAVIIMDVFILTSVLMALCTILYNFFILYKYYPYRNRGRFGFKKPNLLEYTINSLLPNNISKKL
jgi:hypothetical protein